MRFTYKNEGKNSDMDTLVTTFGKLVDLRVKRQTGTDEYKELNKTFNESIIEFCAEQSGKTFVSVEDVKDPMYTKNGTFQDTFMSVISSVITPVVPKVVSEAFPALCDITQVGFGNNATYQVKSNQLFVINDSAEGIARGGSQTMYNNEFSVKARKKTATVHVDWYLVASGKMDWGDFGWRLAKSFESYFANLIVKSFMNVVSDPAQRQTHGIAGYYIAGMSDGNWLSLKRNVSLANGGANVYALGTEIGLADVTPDSAKGWRFGSQDDIVTKGILPDYKNVPLVVLDDFLVPNTINQNPIHVLDDNFIYFIAAGSSEDKPVKGVIEGNTVTVEKDQTQMADETLTLTISVRIGVDVIVGSKFGILQKN